VGQALAARITWATMTEVHREDPLIGAIVTAGVVTAEQVDELFRMAAERPSRISRGTCDAS
jgi:hypothetical protein